MVGAVVEHTRRVERELVVARHRHVDRIGQPFARLEIVDDETVFGVRSRDDVDTLRGTVQPADVRRRGVVVTDALATGIEVLRFDDRRQHRCRERAGRG